MLKIAKKFGVALIAILITVGFSAYKAVETLTNNGEYISWYFTGEDESELDKPEKYSPDPNDASLCDTGLDIICEILAPQQGTSGEPNLQAPSDPDDEFSDSVEDLIQEAMDNLGTTNITVRSFRVL